MRLTNLETTEDFTIKPWDTSIQRTIFLDILNALNKYRNPESYIVWKEDTLDYNFGKDLGIPSDFLCFENPDGKVVGFTGLFNFKGNVKTWRISYALFPEYLETSLPRMILEASISLAQKSDIPEIFLSTIGSDITFDKILTHNGKSPFHYMWSMKLPNYNQSALPKTPEGITIQFREEIDDYENLASVTNQVFQNHFEFTEITAENLKKQSELLLQYNITRYQMAYDKDKLVGVCQIYIDKENKQTGTFGLGVLPNYQNRGIGSVLLGKGIEYLQTTEVTKIALQVDGENDRALELYKRFGFQVEENLTQTFYRMK